MLTNKVKKFNNYLTPLNAILLICFCLASMNFLGRFYYCAFVAFIVFIFFNRKIYYSGEIVVLFLLCLSFLIFSSTSQIGLLPMIKTFTPTLCFLVGYNLLNSCIKNKKLENSEKIVCLTIIVIAFGAFVHYVLNMFNNDLTSVDRNTTDFWTKTVIAATGQAALAVMMTGVVIATIFSNSKTIYKILSIICLFIILFYNLVLAGRTLFVITLVVASVALLFLVSKYKSKKTVFSVAIILLFIAIFGILVYNFDFLGLKTYIENSNFYQRFYGDAGGDITEEGRFDSKLAFLKYLLDYPFGGGNIKEIVGHFAHDIFLDTYDEASIFAFLFMLIFIISTIVEFIKVMKSKNISYKTKSLILCLYIALYLEFMVEPIMIGMQWMFASFCVVHGAVVRLRKIKEFYKSENS